MSRPSEPFPLLRAVLSRVALLAFGLGVGTLLAEGGLRLIERWDLGDRVEPDRVLPDQRLGHRLAPFTIGTDARGFRNDTAYAQAELVAIGDSQTWGVNARREEAWPQALQALTGRTVYNMSGGSWGLVHYDALIGEALELHPRLVIIGLYFGNDLYDSYRLVYSSPAYASLRVPHPEWEEDTVGPRAWEIWEREKAFSQGFGRSDPRRWGLWLRGHSALGRRLEQLSLWPGDAWYEIGREWARAHPGEGTFYEEAQVRTVLTTGYRQVALDLEEPRIREGLRLSLVMLARLRAACTERGANLLLLLIPTKEMAFAEAQPSRRGSLDATYLALLQGEEEARRQVMGACRKLGIDMVDALPTLRGGLGAGEQLYSTNVESHPNAKGYRRIAEIVSHALRPAVPRNE